MKGSRKAESEKVRFRSLEGREITGQLSMDTPEQKVSKRLLGKKHQKLLVQHWLWYAGEQRRRINGTSEPQDDTIKKGGSQR